MRYTYTPRGICPTGIEFEVNGHVITNIAFAGGCNGNLKAITRLVDGWTAEEIAAKCAGNTCGRRPTSCVDQLAKAVSKAVQSGPSREAEN